MSKNLEINYRMNLKELDILRAENAAFTKGHTNQLRVIQALEAERDALAKEVERYKSALRAIAFEAEQPCGQQSSVWEQIAAIGQEATAALGPAAEGEGGK